MEWTEIILTVPNDKQEEAEAVALMSVPYGIYTEDYSDLIEGVEEISHVDLIDKNLLSKDRTKSRIHIYISPEENPNEAISFITNQLSNDKIDFSVETDKCKNEDWENNWKKYFKPFKVGKNLFIRPAWINDYDPEGRTVLTIEPGSAFGSGTHETTRLCLEALEEHITPETDILDIGCGSGILSISAMLLCAKSAVGVDIDKLAVKTAEENFERNKIDKSKYTLSVGDLASSVKGKFPLIVANIVADAIIRLSEDVPNLLQKDGYYIVSGIIDTRKQDVLTALDKLGFKAVNIREDAGWVCIEFKLK